MTNSGHPTYILIAAVTIDGKIARHANHFTDWTSKEDKDLLHRELDKCDVIVVGNNTYKTAYEPLSKRNCIVFTRSVESKREKNENCLYCNPEECSIGKLLREKGYKRVCILGGTETHNFFLDHDLIDELYITVEPIIFGDGLSLFNSMQEKDIRFQLVSAQKLNDSGAVLLHYKK